MSRRNASFHAGMAAPPMANKPAVKRTINEENSPEMLQRDVTSKNGDALAAHARSHTITNLPCLNQ